MHLLQSLDSKLDYGGLDSDKQLVATISSARRSTQWLTTFATGQHAFHFYDVDICKVTEDAYDLFSEVLHHAVNLHDLHIQYLEHSSPLLSPEGFIVLADRISFPGSTSDFGWRGLCRQLASLGELPPVGPHSPVVDLRVLPGDVSPGESIWGRVMYTRKREPLFLFAQLRVTLERIDVNGQVTFGSCTCPYPNVKEFRLPSYRDSILMLIPITSSFRNLRILNIGAPDGDYVHSPHEQDLLRWNYFGKCTIQQSHDLHKMYQRAHGTWPSIKDMAKQARGGKKGRRTRGNRRLGKGPGGERDMDVDEDEEDTEELSMVDIRSRILSSGFTEAQLMRLQTLKAAIVAAYAIGLSCHVEKVHLISTGGKREDELTMLSAILSDTKPLFLRLAIRVFNARGYIPIFKSTAPWSASLKTLELRINISKEDFNYEECFIHFAQLLSAMCLASLRLELRCLNSAPYSEAGLGDPSGQRCQPIWDLDHCFTENAWMREDHLQRVRDCMRSGPTLRRMTLIWARCEATHPTRVIGIDLDNPPHAWDRPGDDSDGQYMIGQLG
ncbi:hypothetical protein C8T65DRAFT_738352 [Cerioporus squamosus]|nr:hypothetical protein C8T65DRAFT_738352 [Cerioporus squamosus]